LEIGQGRRMKVALKNQRECEGWVSNRTSKTQQLVRKTQALQELHLSHHEIDDDSALELPRVLQSQRPRPRYLMDRDEIWAPVSTTLSSAANAGDTTLPVASTVGFIVGCRVEIEIKGGGKKETRVVGSVGSLVLTSGLEHSYSAGATVTLTAKPIDLSDKAKITVRFRGREMAHQELGRDLLARIEKDLEEYGSVEQRPNMEGRQMIMVLSPGKKKKQP
jgi:hypothetical protein